MSQRLTLGSFKATANWPQTLNVNSSDPRFLLWLNELLYRFLNANHYVGSVQRYRICTTSACVCWPRQFETIESLDICDSPMPIRNQWFEFLENGPGLAHLGRGCQTFNSFDRGNGYAMFDDILVPSKIRLYRSFNADAAKSVTIRGFDLNGQEVFTNNGTVAGEKLTLNSTFVDSETIWMPQTFREVIKDATTGYVRAFSYDATLPPPPLSPGPNDTPLRALAVWEPTETLPNYRRSFIPAIEANRGGCCHGPVIIPSNQTQPTCRKTTVTVMAKIAFIPVANDLDFLWTSNFAALKMGMISLMKQERGDTAGARDAMQGVFDPILKRFRDGAIPLLEDELDAFQGAGTVAPLRLESGMTDRVNIVNLI